METYLKCMECNKIYDESPIYKCSCGGLLEVKYDFSGFEFTLEKARKKRIGVWRYGEILPAKKHVSLNEGGTPLYECRNLGEHLKIKLYVKNEGANPTGSFKDRGMAVGVSKAIEFNKKTVACASTGNTSASLAAYSSRAGMKSLVIIPSGKIAYGKLAQALIYGAKVVTIEGNFDEAFNMVMKICDEKGIYLLNSINPYRLEGQKTIAYEIADEFSGGSGSNVPDRVILPVGNAGNISAIWKGFREFMELGVIEKLPMMTGIQAEGAKPIVEMFKKHDSNLIPEKNPETIATAIRIGNPVSWKKAINAIYESGGYASSASDEEILDAQKLLARKEGIFVEPASASSIAGLIKLLDSGVIDRNEEVVCITTGNGLKDPNIAVERCKDEIIQVKGGEIEDLINNLIK